MSCTCGVVKLNTTTQSSNWPRNWNPDCPVHGVQSAYWNDPDRVAERADQSRRLRDLQIRASKARAAARKDTD